MTRPRLYSPRLIAGCTVLVTPLLGGLLLALNHLRLGDRRTAAGTAGLALGASVVLFLLWEVPLPESALRGATIGGGAALAAMWYRQWNPLFQDHRSVGGPVASPWPPIAFAVAFVGLVLGYFLWELSASQEAFERGARYLEDNDYRAAAETFEDYLEDYPDEPAAQLNLAIAHMRLGRLEEASAHRRHPRRAVDLRRAPSGRGRARRPAPSVEELDALTINPTSCPVTGAVRSHEVAESV